MRKSWLIAGFAAAIPVVALAESYASADAELNAVYGALTASLAPAARITLRNEERAWIVSRNRTCGFEAQNACAIEWVRRRTGELRARLARGGGGAHSPERVGQCFATSVLGTGPRLEGVSDSGTSAEFADGHHMVDYDVIRAVRLWRRGDGVRLCVVSLPRDCPPGDDRGIVYRATNKRTGSTWTAADSQHMCGGA